MKDREKQAMWSVHRPNVKNERTTIKYGAKTVSTITSIKEKQLEKTQLLNVLLLHLSEFACTMSY